MNYNDLAVCVIPKYYTIPYFSYFHGRLIIIYSRNKSKMNKLTGGSWLVYKMFSYIRGSFICMYTQLSYIYLSFYHQNHFIAFYSCLKMAPFLQLTLQCGQIYFLIDFLQAMSHFLYIGNSSHRLRFVSFLRYLTLRIIAYLPIYLSSASVSEMIKIIKNNFLLFL